MSTSTKKLSDKIALVTGASKGIGAGIAEHLGAAGASVAVNYSSSKDGADRVVQAITQAGGKAIAVQGNVARHEDIRRIMADTKSAFGRLDILVNNAGIYEKGGVGEITTEQFHRIFDLNVLGLILTTQEALKLFGDGGGSIINISSVVSTLSPPGGAVYNATKSAVDGITRTFAKELGSRKIRVNSVNPGLVETEGLHSTGFIAMKDTVVPQLPLARIGQPQDIAPAVVFLASDDSSWITGETLYVTGGVH